MMESGNENLLRKSMSKLSEYLKNQQANYPGERVGRHLWGRGTGIFRSLKIRHNIGHASNWKKSNIIGKISLVREGKEQ